MKIPLFGDGMTPQSLSSRKKMIPWDTIIIIVDLTSIRRMCSEIGIPLVTRQVYDIVFGPKIAPNFNNQQKFLKINEKYIIYTKFQ